MYFLCLHQQMIQLSVQISLNQIYIYILESNNNQRKTDMQTEIIKLNSLKQNFMVLLDNLSDKFNHKKDYDVTVIVKQNEERPLLKTSLKSQSDNKIQDKTKKTNVVLFQENNEILDYDEEPSNTEAQLCRRSRYKTQNNSGNNQIKTIIKNIKQYQFLQDATNRKQNYNRQQSVQTSNKFIQTPQSMESIKSNKKYQQNGSIYLGLPSKIRNEVSKLNTVQVPVSDKGSRYQSPLQINTLKSFHTQLQLQLRDQDIQSDQFSVKINQISYLTDKSVEKSKEIQQSDEETGFLIENYLNDALKLIDSNNVNGLQDFLYDFKQRFSFSTVKIQIKWSLLMAYCKEQKLQFQRASINYENSIKLIELHNCNINLEMGDLYCHLGRCHYENREWNKSISSYSKALNLYKAKKKADEYSKCITNLGILYLQIQYLQEAEKCFLMAYSINRSEQWRQNNKFYNEKLITLLFNLMQCNIKEENYMQSQQIIHLIKKMIEENINLEDNHIQLIKYYIKRGKLYFILQNFNKAEKFYKKAVSLLKNNSSASQYLQIYELYGLLKQKEKNWSNSLVYYEQALLYMQRFIPKENQKFKNLKKRIDYCIMKLDEQGHKKKSISKQRAVISELEKMNVTNSLTIEHEFRPVIRKNIQMNKLEDRYTKKNYVKPIIDNQIIWIEDQEH